MDITKLETVRFGLIDQYDAWICDREIEFNHSNLLNVRQFSPYNGGIEIHEAHSNTILGILFRYREAITTLNLKLIHQNDAEMSIRAITRALSKERVLQSLLIFPPWNVFNDMLTEISTYLNLTYDDCENIEMLSMSINDVVSDYFSTLDGIALRAVYGGGIDDEHLKYDNRICCSEWFTKNESSDEKYFKFNQTCQRLVDILKRKKSSGLLLPLLLSPTASLSWNAITSHVIELLPINIFPTWIGKMLIEKFFINDFSQLIGNDRFARFLLRKCYDKRIVLTTQLTQCNLTLRDLVLKCTLIGIKGVSILDMFNQVLTDEFTSAIHAKMKYENSFFSLAPIFAVNSANTLWSTIDKLRLKSIGRTVHEQDVTNNYLLRNEELITVKQALKLKLNQRFDEVLKLRNLTITEVTNNIPRQGDRFGPAFDFWKHELTIKIDEIRDNDLIIKVTDSLFSLAFMLTKDRDTNEIRFNRIEDDLRWYLTE